MVNFLFLTSLLSLSYVGSGSAIIAPEDPSKCGLDIRNPKRRANFPIEGIAEKYNCQKVWDVAQYKGADWSNLVCVYSNVSLEEACQIAQENPAIDYFFYMKSPYMVLERDEGYLEFYENDAVFFSGTPWWGSAKGFSDGYIVNRSAQ